MTNKRMETINRLRLLDAVILAGNMLDREIASAYGISKAYVRKRRSNLDMPRSLHTQHTWSRMMMRELMDLL